MVLKGAVSGPLMLDLRCASFLQGPCPPLKDYYSCEADRGMWVRGLFDRTAGDYDRIERAMALGTGSGYRRRALRRAGFVRMA